MIKILKFGLPTCNPCKVLSNILEPIKNEYDIEDINLLENVALGYTYNVKKVPTLIFLKDDVEQKRVNGLITINKFKEIINEITGE